MRRGRAVFSIMPKHAIFLALAVFLAAPALAQQRCRTRPREFPWPDAHRDHLHGLQGKTASPRRSPARPGKAEKSPQTPARRGPPLPPSTPPKQYRTPIRLAAQWTQSREEPISVRFSIIAALTLTAFLLAAPAQAACWPRWRDQVQPGLPCTPVLRRRQLDRHGAVPRGRGNGLHGAEPPEGVLLYNNDAAVMQYCDGAEWVAMWPSAPNDDVLDSLVGHWKFNDGTGSATAADSSGSGNTGTLTEHGPGRPTGFQAAPAGRSISTGRMTT